jgi:tripartite-type tricarboxylate transporter receptor subunit TctC
VVDRLNAALRAVIEDGDVRQRMREQEAVASSPEELAETVRRETPRPREMVETSGARLG